jgi:hypothetical protein
MTENEARAAFKRHRIRCGGCGALVKVVSFGRRLTSFAPIPITTECCFGRARFSLALRDIEDSTPLTISVTVNVQPTKEDNHHARNPHADDHHDLQPDAQHPDAAGVAAAARQRRHVRRSKGARRGAAERRSIAP